MQPQQMDLFSPHASRLFNYHFPSTRYQGSKRTLLEWIWQQVAELDFNTVLDVFGGTGAVSHLFKTAGKAVTYNDALAFNQQIGLALIENAQHYLSEDDLVTVLTRCEQVAYPDFIERTFEDIYFTKEENRWLDYVVYNIDHSLNCSFKQAIARFALYQACIIKRPYNLFHRANLYMRTAHVKRNFGNKATWDTPFEVHFRQFVTEANKAIFDNHQQNSALRLDAFETPTGKDLVYIDPPYINQRGVGLDYADFYHFLEGLTDYAQWPQRIDYASKHRRLQPQRSVWSRAESIKMAFDKLIERHQRSILVISYRDDGIPSQQELYNLLKRYKQTVAVFAQPKQYVLSHSRSHELLFIAR